MLEINEVYIVFSCRIIRKRLLKKK